MASKRPTTTDIARLAGVSQSTVSMILSGRPSVSFSPESTRADVDALAGGLTEITKTRIAAR